jgi:signal transduction histidine kinase
MAQLIDDLLDLARVARCELTYRAVDLSAMASSIIDELRRTDPNREVATEIGKGIVAYGDPALLRAVMENLLRNAWKFTSRRNHAEIEFGMIENGGASTFFVRDNGAGFDETYAHKLFGTFQRLHSGDVFPGTGVGLAIVKRIVQRHGGTVSAASVEGQGATFTFTLMRNGREAAK